MRKYKLTQHLKELCEQNPEYANLYSTWILNQKTCSDILKNVLVHYPHFSLHDVSHAEAVLSKMEMVLGDRIQYLSPTDTWLLLHAAYAHDLGMVLEWEKIETKWKETDFQDWLADQEKSRDEDLRKAVAFIKKSHDLGTEETWPLDASRCVSLINETLFRSKHAQMSKEYIEFVRPELGLDLGHNNLIQPRLVKLLGQICKMHTDPLCNVMKLDYETNGFNSDYAHPRFVTMMLRLGDLLDIDNGRFNKGALATTGGLPETSKTHLEKHEATTHLLVTPREIRFRSDCPNSEAYLEARRFVTWLEDEVGFLNKNWALIVPEDLGGYAPRFDHKELLICGVPDIEGVAELKFEISQDKAFQMIEGSNIYKDRFVFIREVIQNALDASKLQMWKDLCSGTYHAWDISPDDKEKLKELQPGAVDSNIFRSYPVRVKLSTPSSGQVEIEVTDRGTGISVDSFKRMCNVGESNESAEHLKKTIRDMPNWLRPTAGFGIGLQSIFLVADQFEIDTSTGQETLHAVVHSKRDGGYLQLQRADKTMPRGTTIRIRTNTIEEFAYTQGFETDQYVELHMDPLDPENHMCEVRVLEAIHKGYRKCTFPLKVICQEESVDDYESPKNDMQIGNYGSKKWKDRYIYEIKELEGEVSFWDTKEAAYARFQLDSYEFSIYFKGIKVDKNPFSLTNRGIGVMMDLYGLDTKQTITLNRESFTNMGKWKVYEMYNQYQEVFKEIFLEKLKSTQSSDLMKSRKYNPYTFWLCCTKKQRKDIPKEFIEQIKDEVVVIAKKEDGKYEKQHVLVREIIENDNLWYIDIDGFRVNGYGREAYNFAEICDILDEDMREDVSQYIADQEFARNAVSNCWHHQVHIISREGHRDLVCYTLSDQQLSIEVLENQTSRFLRGLGEPIVGLSYARFNEKSAKRYAIPALKGYELISVKDIPHYIGHPYKLNTIWIVAPFVREDVEAYGKLKLSKEAFAERILSAETFSWVVDWVQNHSIYDTQPKREEISDCYKKLIYAYCDVLDEKKA